MKEYKFIAKTFAGLETVLADELTVLGAKEVKPLLRGVSFSGDKALMYKVNYQSRLTLRVLMILESFPVRGERDLYQNINKIEWEHFLDSFGSLAVDAVSFHQKLTHTLFISQLAKDAVVDRIRSKENRRPSVDLISPDLRINLHLDQKDATISLDSSDSPLFKRGYRVGTIDAPINEVLAAGLLALTGWNGEKTLYDPMCGSGTFLIEAAMKATNTPAGKFRNEFGFMKWQDFDAQLWNKVKSEADNAVVPLTATIKGSDISRKSLSMTRRNLQESGFLDQISLEAQDFFKQKENFSGTIITNPPYNERMSLEDMEAFYKNIGSTLKHFCVGSDAWIITSNMEAVNAVGLRPAKKIKIFNGKLECRFLKYEIYSGSKKIVTGDK